LTLGYESGLGFGNLACGSSSPKWESLYPNFPDLFLFPRWEMGWDIWVIVDDVMLGCRGLTWPTAGSEDDNGVHNHPGFTGKTPEVNPH